MQDLTVALIQTSIEWHNAVANREALENKVKGLSKNVDLVLLPEMFTTGFTMRVETNAEPVNGTTLDWMKNLAKDLSTTIAGSVIVEEEDKYFNRLYWVGADGSVEHYDKRHLFRMADEDKFFSDGKTSMVMEVNGWKIKPLICYDLRFPVWSRNQNLEYDLITYVANWPKARVNAWDALLRARAIENLSYAIGVNRVGKDGMDIEYNGHSACYDFKGEPLNTLSESEEIIYVTLSKSVLSKYREKFPAQLDADEFDIRK